MVCKRVQTLPTKLRDQCENKFENVIMGWELNTATQAYRKFNLYYLIMSNTNICWDDFQ